MRRRRIAKQAQAAARVSCLARTRRAPTTWVSLIAGDGARGHRPRLQRLVVVIEERRIGPRLWPERRVPKPMERWQFGLDGPSARGAVSGIGAPA